MNGGNFEAKQRIANSFTKLLGFPLGEIFSTFFVSKENKFAAILLGATARKK